MEPTAKAKHPWNDWDEDRIKNGLLLWNASIPLAHYRGDTYLLDMFDRFGCAWPQWWTQQAEVWAGHISRYISRSAVFAKSCARGRSEIPVVHCLSPNEHISFDVLGNIWKDKIGNGDARVYLELHLDPKTLPPVYGGIQLPVIPYDNVTLILPLLYCLLIEAEQQLLMWADQ